LKREPDLRHLDFRIERIGSNFRVVTANVRRALHLSYGLIGSTAQSRTAFLIVPFGTTGTFTPLAMHLMTPSRYSGANGTSGFAQNRQELSNQS
jgi:hypothetical protein